MKYKIAAILLGGIFSLLTLEACLRIYNPIHVPLRAWKVALPTNQTFSYKLIGAEKFDEKVTNTYNSLGFRGPERPKDSSDLRSIIMVGGSTTACGGLSDDSCWPELVYRNLRKSHTNLWINNAGQNGHSTFGHLMLLRQVLRELKPDHVVYLIGINDVGRQDLTDFDTTIIPSEAGGLAPLIRYSELLSTLQVFVRTYRAYDLGLGIHGEVDFNALPYNAENPEELTAKLQEHRTKFIPGYEHRVLQLLHETRAAGIEPILMTQPALFGDVIDPTTQRNLGTIEAYGASGNLREQELELYNQKVREIAIAESVFLVDLANLVPKDSALYGDFVHHSRKGQQVLAKIVSQHLESHLFSTL